MGVQQFLMMKIKSRIITTRRLRHLHYFMNISQMYNLHIQYCENVQSAEDTFCGVHEIKIIENKFLRMKFFTIKMQEGEDLLVHINMVKALANKLRSIELKIEDEDVYMVLLMSLPPSFDNLVTSLESMSTKDVDFQFIVVRLFHEISKRKEKKVRKMLHYLTKLIMQMKIFAFIAKNLDTL